MRKFISWRRVSTGKQGRSGLGLEAQKQIIDYCVEHEHGELLADYCEVYTGTELSGCTELRKAMNRCKKTGATLIIAKSDRFRNTVEALQIYEEMGDGNIYFCDLPRTDKFIITLFFALAEREALITSIRTRAALEAKRARGEMTGGTNALWGKNTGADRDEAIRVAVEAASASKKRTARENPENRAFRDFIEDWEEAHGKVRGTEAWEAIVTKLNSRGRRTATGMPYTATRAKAMYAKIKRLYK